MKVLFCGVNSACREKVIILYLKNTLEALGWSGAYRPTLTEARMSLSLDDVKRIAQLARLEVTDADAERVLAQLQPIFVLIEELQSVDTHGIEPMSHAQDVSLRLRDDLVTELDHRDLFQGIAPQVRDGLYLVPKVIE
jgi:aspartyl-tRNA(Asn)/glutamyl-tRNA(Gln) amidotransferase subunit C